MIFVKEKYAELLLESCLNIKECDALLITGPIEAYEFLRILAIKAYEYGVKDVKFDFEDETLKKLQLENLQADDFKDGSFWDKSIYDKYVTKNSAFLTLTSYEDLSSELITEENLSSSALTYRMTKSNYKIKQLNYEVPWCIAGVATKSWADKLFPNEENNIDKLWNLIYEICYIDQPNPLELMEVKQKYSTEKCNYMTNMQFESLNFKNSLGTNLNITLPKNHVWNGVGVSKNLPNRKAILVNMPSYEIFSSPMKYGVNGVVYASKPLVYNGILIEGIVLEFKNGKVISYNALSGIKALEVLLKADENSSFLGEVALVDNDNPISNSGVIFYETLYDENSACHLALGNGFTSVINELDYTEEEIKECINHSNVHVDFMIGTDDLVVTAFKNNEEILIVENGNFVKKLLIDKKIK